MPPSNKYDKKKKENQKEGENGTKSDRLICCVPADKVYCQNPEIESLSAAVKCICSSGKCTMSGYMHTECFNKYEEIIVGYMSKAGRGRTWNDKQRYANVWANKGYDLVFKTCVCDCGHGSLRKDVDWVAPKPEAEAQAAPPEKKKKKEKAEGKLKPKLNFTVQTVQGSYYGSNTNRDEEEGEDKPAPSLPSMRAFVRETSIDNLVPSTPKSATPTTIPGLSSLLPATSKPKPEPKVERSTSQATLPTSSFENDPDGWTVVSKSKERSESGSRRNSVHQIKQGGKKKWPSGDSTSSQQSNSTLGEGLKVTTSSATPDLSAATAAKLSATMRPSPTPDLGLGAETARLLQKVSSKSPLEMLATSRPSPKASPSLQAASPFSGLPMFQPVESCFSYSTPYAGAGSSMKYSVMEPAASSSLFSSTSANSTPYESALTYTSRDSVPAPVAPPKTSSYFGGSLGARPKSGKLSSSPDDIFHSSDEEDRGMDGLLKDLVQSTAPSSTLPTTPGSLTPKWEDVPSTKGDADKEMAQVWEQTQLFEQQLGNNCKQEQKSTSKAAVKSNKSKSCRLDAAIVRSSKHIENSIWAEKLAGGSADLKNTLGWGGLASGEEAIVPPGSTWQHELRPSKEPGPLRTLDSVIGQSERITGSSRPDIPEAKKTSDKLEDEVLKLRAELEKERAAKTKALAEVEREKAGKRLVEKQSLIVENTLKAEKEKANEFKMTMEKLSEKLKEQESEAKSGKRGEMAMGEGERFKDLEEKLAAEVAKNEANSKVIKKLREKVERAEKSSLKEKDLKLLAEKTLELVNKDKKSEETKRKDAEASLAAALSKVKESEAKLRDEMRKRISAEVELATLKEKEETRRAELDLEQNALAASVKQLIKEKEEIEKKNDEARVEAVHRLEARGCEGSVVQKIVQDSESIVKKTLEKAVENEDIDSYGDVSKIFKIVSDAMLKPGSSVNSEITEMVSEIAGTYRVDLNKVKKVNEIEDERDFEKEASESDKGTKSDPTSCDVKEKVEETNEGPMEKLSETMRSSEPDKVDIDEARDDVVDLKRDDAEADVISKHEEKTVDNPIRNDGEVENDKTKREEGATDKGDDLQGPRNDPFDDLLERRVVQQEGDSKGGEELRKEDVFGNATEKFTPAAEMRYHPTRSLSEEMLSVEEDGLDRYPKLGLDHEIDPYLGSPTVSRAWSPLEQACDAVNDGVSRKEEEEKAKEIPDKVPLEPRLSSSGSSPAAWPMERSESSTSGLGSEVKELMEENQQLYTLESNMREMQHMIVNLSTTVTSLNNQVEDTKMRNGLLLKTVEVMQEKNSRLERTVESVISRNCSLESKVEGMLGKHSLLERRFSQNQLKAVHGALDSNASIAANNSDEVSGMKESLLELLASCETFQKGFDDMSDKQGLLEMQTKSLREDTSQFKAESEDMREQFAKLSDKFASLNLECQVDKGNFRAQLEQLGYNIALLTTKLPTDSFPSHKDSSTSGIKSAESSEADTTSATPPPKDVKKIVEQLVFSNEAALAAEMKRTSASPKTGEKTAVTKTSADTGKSNRKVVYNQNAVNHLPQPPFPGLPGSNLWMSPDGGMVAIPPNGGGSGNPPRPPMPMWGMGGMGRGTGMAGMGQPFAGAPVMYPLNYPMFYPHPGPPR